jgi:hypothetical protein
LGFEVQLQLKSKMKKTYRKRTSLPMEMQLYLTAIIQRAV